MKDFLIETSSQRKEINWNKMSSFYQNNNSSLIDAFYNAKSQNQFLVITTCRKYYQIQQKLIKLRVKLFSWFKQSKIFL